ncbi:hypothetical protein QUF58_02570 [Anaerolineales bacterium HSG24]|nr:hypothetical protein [Anaerolineales bacterium HSG24]
MSIMINNKTIPEKGSITLKIDRTFEIRVTAKQAQRTVNHWVQHEVSYLMRALAPILVVDEKQIVWQTPISFGVPHLGQVGTIGTIEVDIVTGQMTNSGVNKAKLINQAERLATQLPPYQPHQEISPEFLVHETV